jgi:hypothetical protein
VTPYDPVLKKLFGFKRMVNFKATTRLCRKIDQSMNTWVLGNLYRWFFGNLHADGFTLDLDSTVMPPDDNRKARRKLTSTTRASTGAIFITL